MTHIVNARPDEIPNMYDLKCLNTKKVKKLHNELNLQSNLVGTIKYFNIDGWTEHKITRLDDIGFVKELYNFMQEAAENYTSCLVLSSKNKCSTVVVCMIYLLMKFKWDLTVALQFINSRKIDIEITKSIIKKLNVIQGSVQEDLKSKRRRLRHNWDPSPDLSNSLSDDSRSLQSLVGKNTLHAVPT